jgi:hypothetical protein
MIAIKESEVHIFYVVGVSHLGNLGAARVAGHAHIHNIYKTTSLVLQDGDVVSTAEDAVLSIVSEVNELVRRTQSYVLEETISSHASPHH